MNPTTMKVPQTLFKHYNECFESLIKKKLDKNTNGDIVNHTLNQWLTIVNLILEHVNHQSLKGKVLWHSSMLASFCCN
jgi:hypothetical protein